MMMMMMMMKMICSFSQVKSILVNIFGGIVDCSIIANGITSAYERLNVKVPVIVRLEGELNSRSGIA